MASMSLIPILFLALFGGNGIDLLEVVDPAQALEILGEKTEDVSLEALISGGVLSVAAAPDYDKQAAERAIQNLASSTESVRDSAREKLAGMGPALRPRLEEVVAKDPRRAEEAKKVLTVFETGAKDAGRKKDVARLLAVRLAGTRKLEKCLPLIRTAAESKDPFLLRAAEKAIAKLAPSAAKTAVSDGAAAVSAAVEALPSSSNLCAVLRPDKTGGDEGPSLDTLFQSSLAQMFALQSDVGGDSGTDPVKQALHEATKGIVDFVVRFGNVRLERVTIVNVGKMDDHGAGLALVIDGRYEPEVLVRGLEETSGLFAASEASGRKVYTSPVARLVPLDERSVLVLPQQASLRFPLPEYLEAFKAGQKAFRASKRWDKFLGTVEGDAYLRGLVLTDADVLGEILTEADREAPPEVAAALRGMKEAELDLRLAEGTKLSYRFEAEFQEAKQATDLSKFTRDAIAQGVAEMERSMGEMQAMLPPAFGEMMKSYVESMKGIKVVGEGKKGILRGELDAKAILGIFGTARVGSSSSFESVEAVPVGK